MDLTGRGRSQKIPASWETLKENQNCVEKNSLRIKVTADIIKDKCCPQQHDENKINACLQLYSRTIWRTESSWHMTVSWEGVTDDIQPVQVANERSPARRHNCINPRGQDNLWCCSWVTAGELSARPVWIYELKKPKQQNKTPKWTKNPNPQISVSYLICFIFDTYNCKLLETAYLHFFPCKLQDITEKSKQTTESYTFLSILSVYTTY